MPAVLHTPSTTTPGFMLKEKTGEPLVPAFTAVNGRTSPTSPRQLYGMNGMTADTTHVRPISRQSPEQPPERQVPSPTRAQWASLRRLPENDHETDYENHHQNGHPSPSLSDEDQSSSYAVKRKRSSSAEDSQSDHS